MVPTNGTEWTDAEVRRVGGLVVDLIARYLAELSDEPVFRPVPREQARAWASAPPPLAPATPDDILADFAREIAVYPFGNGHPRFFGWVNSPPTVIGIFAEALAATMNPSVAGGNHAAVYVEHQVVAWVKAILGAPAEAMGLLVSGSSAAALTALAVARTAACRRLGWDVRADGLPADARLRVYASAEAHSCHQKAVEILGLGRTALRAVPTDAALRLDPVALDGMIADDLARGDCPMAVVASAGTVNTGAIDPLGPIADVCARRGLWLHVDGAYGAPAILTDAYREALAPIARADSVAMDPHKWLSVPVESGLVVVRDAALMRETFSLVPAYLRTDENAHGVQGPPWFSEYGIQQTRGFRALKTWMALRHHGFAGYAARITRDCGLAARLAAGVRALPSLELWEPSSLSIVCFRIAGSDERNRAVLRDIQLGGRAFLSGTVLDGRFWLRACLVNHLTQESDIDALIDEVLAAAARAA